jgi:acyl phosphate:glycerol-3-phosphate acyltransferase
MTGFLAVALVSYVLGSIPSGYLISRLAGIDIRQHGSGNIGATNVVRTLGKKYGYPVFLADFGKGLLSVLLASRLGAAFGTAATPDALEVVAGVCVVLGNAFPVWLRFRGGKGVATSAGMLFGLIPAAVLVAIIIWVIIFYSTRYVSLASVTAAAALPLAVFMVNRLTNADRSLVFYVCLALAVLVIARHRSNLARLRQGTEEQIPRRSSRPHD